MLQRVTIPIPYRQTSWRAAAALSIAICGGCYDGEELLQQAQSAAVKSRLAEVDLGSFKTTLPRDEKSALFTDLNLHVFGTVPRYRLSAVKKQIKTDEYRLRSETLAAVRKCTHQELAEPNLSKLRERIEKVVNSILAEAPVKEVGFYELTLRQR
jgi:hypothetical protein